MGRNEGVRDECSPGLQGRVMECLWKGHMCSGWPRKYLVAMRSYWSHAHWSQAFRFDYFLCHIKIVIIATEIIPKCIYFPLYSPVVDPALCPSLHAVPSSLLSQQSHHHQPKSSRASHIPHMPVPPTPRIGAPHCFTLTSHHTTVLPALAVAARLASLTLHLSTSFPPPGSAQFLLVEGPVPCLASITLQEHITHRRQAGQSTRNSYLGPKPSFQKDKVRECPWGQHGPTQRRCPLSNSPIQLVLSTYYMLCSGLGPRCAGHLKAESCPQRAHSALGWGGDGASSILPRARKTTGTA